MESYSKDEADNMLSRLSEKTNAIDLTALEDVRIEMPVRGVSNRKRHGKNHIWVGTDITSDGWIEESEFKKINNNV
jgi:primosomal replication protein N